MKFYRAPWDKSLVTISLLGTLLCLGIAFCPHTAATPANPSFFWLRAVPPVLVVVTAFFTVRGYTITPTEIRVHRLGWTTRLPLAGLESAKVEADAMRSALRLFGNGGLFAFTGLYRNRTLGSFRAFVTDRQRTVVLRYSEKTTVLSPDDPTTFTQNLVGLCR